MIYTPKVHQLHGTEHILAHPYCGLFLDMGLGKTVLTLTAIDQLMFDSFEVKKVLVVAPKNVTEMVWSDEIEKWDHLKHLRISIVKGSEKQRKNALKREADIYAISRDNIAWLVALYGGAFPFDMVVLDESSSFKSQKSQRYKAIRLIRPKLKRLILLTGTPIPNGLLDLWPQMYLMDRGERLGKTITGYRDRYFQPDKRNRDTIFSYKLKDEELFTDPKELEREIYQRISDICISMKSEDFLDLPPVYEHKVYIDMPEDVMAQYLELEEKQVLEFLNERDEEEEISVLSAAALNTKLQQLANGAIYRADKSYIEFSDAKIDVVKEHIEAVNGQPYLLMYAFQSDYDRLMKALKPFKPRQLKNVNDVRDWNAKKEGVYIAHPASIGHGLNMQDGGDYIGWFGHTWNLEYYQQTMKRIPRQGRLKPVFNYRFICKGTLDEEIIASNEGKADKQDDMMRALKARIKKYKK